MAGDFERLPSSHLLLSIPKLLGQKHCSIPIRSHCESILNQIPKPYYLGVAFFFFFKYARSHYTALSGLELKRSASSVTTPSSRAPKSYSYLSLPLWNSTASYCLISKHRARKELGKGRVYFSLQFLDHSSSLRGVRVGLEGRN